MSASIGYILTKSPTFPLGLASQSKKFITGGSPSIRLSMPEKFPVGRDCEFLNVLYIFSLWLRITGFKKSYNQNVPAIIESLNLSIKLAKQKKVAGIVTLPVMKKTLIINGFNYPGHTEYLGKVSNKRPLMIMLNKKLKVATLTTHIPITQVPKKITKSNLEKTIKIYIESLKLDFGLTDPKVAVSSLNPHNGEEGEIGNEEIKIIKPIIDKFKKQGNKINGPNSADTMFHKEALKNIDANLCMFHDQALIPIKSSDFYGSINFTAGLPFIRTSPDHGTAFDIAGENKANSSSLTNAIRYVNLIYNQRINNEKKLWKLIKRNHKGI